MAELAAAQAGTAVAVREPASLVEVDAQCSAVEAWAAACESIPALCDASNKLAAIDEYLARTSTVGRARVAAAMRRLEVRIGELLGPARTGDNQHTNEPSFANDGSLTRNQRREFRQMAEHPEVVEEVIAQSSDQRPPSRRSVMQRLAAHADANPVDPPSPKSRAGVDARVTKARQMAEEGYTSRQIAAAIGIGVESMPEFRGRHGIEVPADKAVGRPRRHDSTRILNETVTTLEAVVMGLDLIEVTDLDQHEVEHWAASLTNSIRSLNRFTTKLKEATRD